LDAGQDQSVIEENNLIKARLSNQVTFTVLYADGESNPISRNQPFHRTWSVSALVLGSEYDADYLVAARSHFFSLIDREQGNFADNEDPILSKILHAAMILTQADGGHVRLFKPDNIRSLEKRVPFGSFSNAMLPLLRLDDKPSQDMTVKAFQSMAIEPTNRPYAYGPNPPKNWPAINKRVKWRVGAPIIAGKAERLGVLSLNSSDSGYCAAGREEHVKSILGELARRTAIALKAHLMRANLLKMFGSLHERANDDRADEVPTLKDSSAPRRDNDEIHALIEQGAKMLGAHAFLMLLVPDHAAKMLRCVAYYPSPNKAVEIQVSIDPSHSPQKQGIAGHLYLHPTRPPEDYLYDHVSDADGKEDRPRYVDCLKDDRVNPLGMGVLEIEQNYAVIVPSRNSSAPPLGILIAESSADMLEKQRDLPLLQTIARACQKTLLQQKAHEENVIFLKTLLPSHIVDQLGRSNGGKSWVRDPEAQRITILNADIRGYTRMSEIVGEANMLNFQNNYFALVVKAVHAHNGTLDKFMGDGVMALFDFHRRAWEANTKSDRESEDEALVKDVIDAVKAGMRIAAEFKTLSETWLPIWRKRHVAVLAKHRFTIGVAIHCGNPITGLFKTESTDESSLPSGGHTTYTIMGRDANLGARVCGAVRNNSVWVTAPCRELLLQQKEFRDRMNESVRLLPDVQIEPDPEENEPDAVSGKMKGIPHPIDIFKIQQAPSRASRRRK